MRKIQIVMALFLLVLTVRAYGLDLGGIVKKTTGGSTTSTTNSGSTTTPAKNGVIINNSDNAEKFKKEWKDFLKANPSSHYNTFYDCFEAPYATMLSAAEARYGKATRKDAHIAQWLFKTGGRDGRDSCTQVELDDAVGRNSSGAHGVKLNFGTGWCDFLSERNKLPVQ